MESLFLFFGNLPLHPLAVHFAVALFPIAVLFLLVTTVWKKAREKFLSFALLATIITLPLVFLAQQSGEALADAFYEPQPHSEYGEQLMPLALATVAAGTLLWISIRKNWNKLLSQVAGFAIVPLSIASLAMTFVVGHSGAEAVWAGKINPSMEQGQPLETQGSQTQESTSTASEQVDAGSQATEAGLTASEVSKHNTPADCWVVIDGTVYQLDKYMNQHPGGKAVLSNLCGKDATQAFSSQHARQALPQAELKKLAIGPMAVASKGGSVNQPTQEATANTSSTAYAGSAVAKHSTASDCWTVVGDNVYNLSGYAADHPGGASNIAALCGKDATASFSSQHGFGGVPANVLAAMAIGTIEPGSGLPPTNVVYGDNESDDDDREDD